MNIGWKEILHASAQSEEHYGMPRLHGKLFFIMVIKSN